MEGKGVYKFPPASSTKKLLTIDNYWETKLVFFKVVAMLGLPYSSGWPHTQEFMCSNQGTQRFVAISLSLSALALNNGTETYFYE